MRIPANIQRAMEREQAVYDAVLSAARAGLPCPTNHQLCEIAGYSSAASSHRALQALAAEGRIEIVSLRGTRRVVRFPTIEVETADFIEARSRSYRPILQIIEVCAKTAGLTVEDVAGKQRSKLYTRPRAIACHFARAEGWSYGRIAHAMGRRDHSTIIHSCSVVAKRSKADPLFARLMQRTKLALAGQTPRPIPFKPSTRPKFVSKMEIGDDYEIHAVPEPKTRVADPLLTALRMAHPERFAA